MPHLSAAALVPDDAITFDKPTAETSVSELTDLVVNECRRARLGIGVA